VRTEPEPTETRVRGAPSVRVVVLFLVGVALLYLLGGLPLQILLGEAGLAISQLALLLLPALLLVTAAGYDPERTLFLRRPTRLGAAGAVLLMAGGIPLAWFLAWLQSFFVPVPHELLELMTEFLATEDARRFFWLLVLVAAIPAVSEEFVFRGITLSGFGSRFSAPLAVVLSALVFGIFHLSPQTAFRFLPTAWLGVLLAWIVVETRSIWLSVGLHFANNALILVLLFLPLTREMAMDMEREPPLALLPVAVLALAAGATLLRRARVEREEAPRSPRDAGPPPGTGLP
jgi:membrane protease YdiL (CAAX protease family)